jgi:hypothetical protein
MNPIVEESLMVAQCALREARRRCESNACSDSPRDAATLREVYALILDALPPVTGALGVLQLLDTRDTGDLGVPPPASSAPRLRVAR